MTAPYKEMSRAWVIICIVVAAITAGVAAGAAVNGDWIWSLILFLAAGALVFLLLVPRPARRDGS